MAGAPMTGADEATPTEFLPNPGAPALPEGATTEQREDWWYKHVYKGDSMPQLTVRAVVMGAILGMLMSASNLYTTLKIGWAFGVVVTACVVSFVAWNAIRLLSMVFVTRLLTLIGCVAACYFLYARFGALTASIGESGAMGLSIAAAVGAIVVTILVWLRPTKMTILENNCMASTASAAGYSTGSTLATMFGTLLMLRAEDPLNGGSVETPANVSNASVSPLWVVASFTLFTAALGVFLAIPLKRQMINREMLRFPTGMAAATTLKSLYAEGREAMQKAWTLITGIVIGLVVGVINTPEGVLKWIDDSFIAFKSMVGFSPRIPEGLPETGIMGMTRNSFANMTTSGQLTLAPADPAKGVLGLPGFNFELSTLLVAAGVLTGLRACLSMIFGALLLFLVIAPMIIAQDFAHAGDAAHIQAIKPRGANYFPVHWGLWGGTAVMVFASLTTVALSWRTIVRSFTLFKKGANPADALGLTPEAVAIARRIEVPMKWLVIGLVPIGLALIALQYAAFQIDPWLGAVAVSMSFILALVACRATGETDTTPIGAMGKVMQLTFAVLAKGQTIPNVAAAGVAANSAIGAADLLTDLKGGYMLGANPRKQFLAQFVGCFFGTLAVVPAWYLMVPNYKALDSFAKPATMQWYAVTKVLTEGFDKLPGSAKWIILIGALIGVGLPIIERLTPAKYRKFTPSAMGLGLSWVIPFSSALGFATGASLAWIWSLIHRRSERKFSVPLASGLIAGESLIKAIIVMSATAVGLQEMAKKDKAGATNAPAITAPADQPAAPTTTPPQGQPVAPEPGSSPPPPGV